MSPDDKLRPVTDGPESRCERCGDRRPDVRKGPGTGERRLCNDCWVRTPVSRD